MQLRESQFELELMLLGLVLNQNSDYWKLTEVEAKHFQYEFHAELFSFMSQEIQSGKEVSILTVHARFPDCKEVGGQLPAYLQKGQTLATGIVMVGQYVDAIIDGYNRRKLADAMERALSKLRSGSAQTIPEIMEDVEAAINTEDTLVAKPLKESEIAAKVYEGLKKASPAFSTGIVALDLAMEGGIRIDRSYCIAARMKQGKTVMLSTISHNLAKSGVPHLFIACEMGSQQIYQRDIARALGRNSLDFLKPATDGFKKSVAEYVISLKSPRWFIDAPGISFSELKRIVLTAIKHRKLKGIVLDYLQLVGGKDRSMSEADHQASVAQWIADTCRKYGIFALYAAQINREGNIRGSDGIVMAADQVFHLHRLEESKQAWMECLASRYTLSQDVGSEDFPALLIDNRGPHFRDIAA